MNKTNVIDLCCPTCHFPIKARLKNAKNKFLLYICPRCLSNVIHYDKKTDTISDKMVSFLKSKKKISICGTSEPSKIGISKKDVFDLKTFLESTDDSEQIIKGL